MLLLVRQDPEGMMLLYAATVRFVSVGFLQLRPVQRIKLARATGLGSGASLQVERCLIVGSCGSGSTSPTKAAAKV